MMKAIIFNSGLGKRMGEFTNNNHKSMAVLNNGETIFERQIRILNSCGIDNFVVTTGPFSEQLKSVSEKFNNITFNFVHNPIYDKTNYIYSMYLATKYFDDDFLLLHGDLVFNKELVNKIINDSNSSTCLINIKKQLPQKDFKGRIEDNLLKEVSINIFDNNCYAFQPLYKLSKDTLLRWSKQVEKFIKNGNDKVYAEEALNEILEEINICPLSYENDYIDEIDNLEDYKRVKDEIEEFEKRKIN